MANPRMTAEIGRVLGGRYRLVAPIGMGASAQVYLADDVKLRRRVALKMLHDALAGDAEFLRRFRAEARAAAALSHPNIMAVYDWSDGSDDGDTAFIVTEYLPGGSLRALLDAGAQLSPAQALGVGLEAARALDYAHRRGFVHRDIKPANLLFGEEQRLRIADFGLARALAEAAWTEPQGAVLGTARYASPEQAKGERLSGKADVYALALVLVEAVTGEVPFVADTTLGTLMARVDKPLVVPDALGPLQSVLEGAGHPDPEERIDARTLARGLLRAAKELSRPAPLPLVGALVAGAALGVDADPTIHGPDAAAAPTDLTAEDLDLDPPSWVNQADAPDVAPAAGAAAVGAAGAVASGWAGDDLLAPDDEDRADDDLDDLLDGGEPTAAIDVADLPPEPPAVADAEPEPDLDGTELVEAELVEGEADEPLSADDSPAPAPERAAAPAFVIPPPEPGTDEVAAVVDEPVEAGTGERRRRRWPWLLLVLALVAAVIGGVAVATMGEDVPDAPPIDLPVPNVVGRPEAEARAILGDGGWKVTVVRERRDGSTKGEVLESRPTPGTRLPDGRTVTLTVSDGQTIVDVPTDLAGKTLEEATAALDAVGLTASTAEEPYDEDAPKGTVIRVAEGTGARLEKGSAVPLVVSNGPEPRTIPDGLVGGSEEAAVAALDALGLEAAIVRSYSDTVDEGVVISVLPRAGETVERGSSVNVEVSRGPELVAVPSIASADTIAEAISIISSAGLTPGSVSGPAAGTPVGTSPGAGTQVRPGSTVNIVLG